MEEPMNTTKQVLLSQYEKCFKMLAETIAKYDEQLWVNDTDYDSPAWQVVYHALYYANIYCSSTRERIVPWPKARGGYHQFGDRPSSQSEQPVPQEPYSRGEMNEFLEFVRRNVPLYLEEMQPHDRCWPPWYEESQLEFQLNNIRHIQHHIGQAIERHDIEQPFEYKWY
jgi:hypothetical protein